MDDYTPFDNNRVKLTASGITCKISLNNEMFNYCVFLRVDKSEIDVRNSTHSTQQFIFYFI